MWEISCDSKRKDLYSICCYVNISVFAQVLACLGEYEDAVKTMKEALAKEPSNKVSSSDIRDQAWADFTKAFLII